MMHDLDTWLDGLKACSDASADAIVTRLDNTAKFGK